MLEVFARKLRHLFTPDLEEASLRGTTSLALHTFIRCVGAVMHADVQECEGVNSLIKAINSRARNLSLVLLDARVRAKKALGLGARGAPTTWRHRRDIVHRLHRQGVEHFEGGQHVQGETGRWRPPIARSQQPRQWDACCYIAELNADLTALGMDTHMMRVHMSTVDVSVVLHQLNL